MEMVFKFTEGSRLSGDPNIVGKTLHAIKERTGELTPTVIVESAISEDSPLHRYFDWDDSTAASKWRLQQARILVCSVVTVSVDGEETTAVRSFVSINNNYEPLHIVMSYEDMRSQAIMDVQLVIKTLLEKLNGFKEFSDVLIALEQVSNVAKKHMKKPIKSRSMATAR
jgi:hypothetical protein